MNRVLLKMFLFYGSHLSILSLVYFVYRLIKNRSGYDVFVTSGTGMVGLPLRFLVPPRIDILYF